LGIGIVGRMFTGIVEEVGEVISMREEDALELWDG